MTEKSNTIENALAKLDRAKEHLKQLNTEMESDRHANRYGIMHHDDIQTNEHVFIHRFPKTLSTRYAILIGEIVGNIRSAFEYCIWEMVPSSSRVEGKTGFPVIWEQNEYNAKSTKMISGINSSALTLIENLQPFNDGGASSKLYILNELWKRDKHRFLNIASYSIYGLKIIYNVDGKYSHQIYDISAGIVDGAEVGRFVFPNFYMPGVGMIMQIECLSSLRFCETDIASGQEVNSLLNRLVEFGSEVISSLKSTLK